MSSLGGCWGEAGGVGGWPSVDGREGEVDDLSSWSGLCWRGGRGREVDKLTGCSWRGYKASVTMSLRSTYISKWCLGDAGMRVIPMHKVAVVVHGIIWAHLWRGDDIAPLPRWSCLGCAQGIITTLVHLEATAHRILGGHLRSDEVAISIGNWECLRGVADEVVEGLKV